MTLSTQLKDTVTKVPAAAVAANQAFDYVQPTNTHIEQLAAQFGAPLMVLDCEAIRRQYHALKNALPGVVLHFALKPLPLAAVVRTLLEEGASFDLATSGEVDLVASQGVPSERTIHTHPIKRDSDIRDALAYGCTVFVVDNINELEKFIAYKDQAEILVRLSFRNKDAFADLSKKFGCSPDVAIDIISYAQQLGIRIKGLSFHVGSQSPNPTKYVEAINACAKVITKVSELGLPALSTLDIGGGFPVPYSVDVLPIDVFCAPINVALAQLPETMQIIAEPGRFIVASSVTSVASVMGQAQRGLMFDEAAYPIDSAKQEGERFESVLAGPTCDSIDVVSDSIMLPKLNNGDLIISRMMGAYTLATATDFNFFKRAEVVVLNEQVHSQVLTG